MELEKVFRDARPVMTKHNLDINVSLALLAGEVKELFQEPTDGMSKEIYLEQELCDVILFAWSILDTLTGDADLAVRDKIARNSVKYPSKYFQDGFTYEEGRDKSKSEFGNYDNERYYEI